MTTVREIMTGDPRSVDADDSVAAAAEVMQELNVGSVPVMADGRIAGIITDRDITLRVIAENRVPQETKVREIATGEPLTVTPDTLVEVAAGLMASRQIRRLPVEEDGALVGMLSLGDVSVQAGSLAGRWYVGTSGRADWTPALPGAIVGTLPNRVIRICLLLDDVRSIEGRSSLFPSPTDGPASAQTCCAAPSGSARSFLWVMPSRRIYSLRR
jgi:CBS domain-containing protein